MNTLDTMKQALEALEWTVEQGGGPVCEHDGAVCFCKENNAITSLRQAIADMEAQEPYGRVTVVKHKGCADQRWYWFYRHPELPYLDNVAECHTLYTHPQPKAEQEPLRGEQFFEMARAIAPRTVTGLKEIIPNWIVEYGRAIEAAHGIK